MCEAGVARTLTNTPIENNTMSYKKPEIVASSEATQSYVAGCPPKDSSMTICGHTNYNCEVSALH